MMIFHRYVSLLEGIVNDHKIWPQMVPYLHKIDPKIPIDIVEIPWLYCSGLYSSYMIVDTWHT